MQHPGGKRIGCPPASSMALVYVEGRITASIFQGPKVESLLQAVTPITGALPCFLIPWALAGSVIQIDGIEI